MENRIYNFNPGPAMQPLEVLQEAQAEFLNFAKSGMSIIEISHRSKQYEQVHNQAKADIKELMGLGDDYEVLFCQGGASMQFTMIPQNFAVDGKVGNYVLSGSFATKAYDEAKLCREVKKVIAFLKKELKKFISERTITEVIHEKKCVEMVAWPFYPIAKTLTDNVAPLMGDHWEADYKKLCDKIKLLSRLYLLPQADEIAEALA